MIKINLNKAKEIHKNNLRIARAEAFKPLDVAFMKALEQGNNSEIEDIKEKKQVLRDITNLPVDIQSLDDLKSYWPESLGIENPYKKL
jgi:hypothetical protein